MEPIGAPVGRDVRSMTPDCADLLSADRLPDPLPVSDGTASEQELSVCCVHIRKWRSLANHLSPNAAEHGERPNDDDGKGHPITFVGHDLPQFENEKQVAAWSVTGGGCNEASLKS